MRKQFFTLSLITGLCAALSMQAQTLFVPGGTVGNISGANVGIGTDNPKSRLEVLVPVCSTQMTLGSPTGVGFGVTNGSYGLYSGVSCDGKSWLQGGRTDGDNTPYDISLQVAGGNVGIGTRNTSAYKLDVQAVGPIKAAYFQTTGSWQAIDFSSDGGITKGSFSAVSNKLYIGTASNGTNAFQTIDFSTGNVGIGTDNPKSRLEVLVPVCSTQMTLGSPTGVGFGVTNGSYGLYSGVSCDGKSWLQGGRTDGDNTPYDISLQVAGGNVGIGTTNTSVYRLNVAAPTRGINVQAGAEWQAIDFSSDATPTHLQGSLSAYDNKIYIGSGGPINNPNIGTIPFQTIDLNTGNVLIGKTTQANTAYKLDVAGSVRANEVVVNTTGADFVFDKNYKLMPIDSLHTYLTKNKHLPGIATATDMQTHGQNVGEMNTQLLQKVEELTLYLIEANKKIQNQNQRLEALEKASK